MLGDLVEYDEARRSPQFLEGAPALADPEDVDATVVDFAARLDPTMPGMYDFMFGSLAC